MSIMIVASLCHRTLTSVISPSITLERGKEEEERGEKERERDGERWRESEMERDGETARVRERQREERESREGTAAIAKFCKFTFRNVMV